LLDVLVNSSNFTCVFDGHFSKSISFFSRGMAWNRLEQRAPMTGLYHI